MSDRAAVTAAVVAVLVALVASTVLLRVPVAVGLAGLAAGLVVWSRRPGVGTLLVVAGLLVVVAARSEQAASALAEQLPRRVEGVAQLASDPEPARFDVQVVVRIGGRRYLARVPHEHASMLRTMLAGEHVQLRGRPSELEGAPAGWVRSQHLAGRLAVQELERGPPAPSWYRVANGTRRTLVAGAASFGETHRPLYLGMVIGDDRAGDELTEHRFRLAGLSHLLVVSGQNVAFVIAVATPLLERLGRRSRTWATLLLIVVFVLVTRADPSVLRAATMAGVATIAVATGRRSPALRALCLAVVVLVVVDPLIVHSLGFQLSVAATAGLVVLARPIERVLPGPRWWTLPASVTIAAQAATAPLLLAFQGALPPGALVANLLAGPAAAAVMMLGATVGLVAGLVAEPVAALLQLPSRAAVAWVDGVARATAWLPLAPADPWRCVVLVVSAGAALVLRRPSAQQGRPDPGRGLALRRGVTAVAVVVAVLVLVPSAPSPGRTRPWPGGELWVGRCGGVVVQLDGAAAVDDVLGELWRRQVRRVDVVLVRDGRAGALAGALDASLGVRSVLRVAPRTGDDATGADVRVGGLRVLLHGATSRIESSGVTCRLAS
jgi:ComEC/Rec2-related protein